ncbi:MAG TPA: M20 family metallopeptidase [Candidatus Acidoferrum sp.]|jgi:glutamate carboxypeptidase
MNRTGKPRTLLNWLTPRLPQMLRTLEAFVSAESPSTEKPACDACARVVAQEWRNRPVRVELLEQKHRGAHLRISYAPGKAKLRSQLFVLGHYDTVYATGTLAKMPFRVAAGRVCGPGVFDMKAGIVQALFALDALHQIGDALTKEIVFLWTSDEEIGSESSRKLLETEAKRSDAVFVLEPALGPKGLLKTARKGVGEAEIIVHGRASHAGLAPEKGVNAIHELAHQIALVNDWNDSSRGISVNAGLIAGGTRSNVIPDRAAAVLDLRALRIADMRRVERSLHRLRPATRGARIEVRGGFNRAPLEHKISFELFQRASSLASEMGLSVGEATAGGGSDGNLTAALGVPTLDGLGAVGDGAHSPTEFVVVRTIPQRAALLAALLLHS